jgi:NADH:ubiquinone oxidoreductase subunit D
MSQTKRYMTSQSVKGLAKFLLYSDGSQATYSFTVASPNSKTVQDEACHISHTTRTHTDTSVKAFLHTP